jgi:hypothetical protein
MANAIFPIHCMFPFVRQKSIWYFVDFGAGEKGE